MRTYDKLIATILHRQAGGLLHPCSGTSAVAAASSRSDHCAQKQKTG
jgi:hypothetical protein